MLRKIKTEDTKRVETGPLQINDDWPGVFIRGDNAFHYAMHLQTVLDEIDQSEEAHCPMAGAVLRGLLSDLLSSDARNIPEDEL